MEIKIINICLFFIYSYGLGHSLTRFVKASWEIVIIRVGVGLGLFPVLGVLMDRAGIPLDWRSFLILSLSLPALDLLRSFRKRVRGEGIRLSKPKWQTACLLLIFIFCVVCYCYGPFTYPWLENDDSWYHAAGAKYVAVEKNLSALSGTLPYLNPYPPGYDMLMGVLHQSSPSLSWTLKFFNGLIVALGILFFYFFALEFMGRERKALLATFFLASIPCYLTHFIWAHSLAVTLFWPAFYLILKARKDWRYSVPASLVVAGILLVQPTQPLKLYIMAALFLIVVLIVDKKGYKKLLAIGFCGALMSMFWYGPVFKEFKSSGLKYAYATKTVELTKTKEMKGFFERVFDPAGGRTTQKHQAYHYLFPPLRNNRNNPFGVGVVISALAILGLFWCFRLMRRGTSEERIYSTTVFLWLLFTFLGCNSKTFNLPVGLFAYRFWALFAVPVSMLAAEAALELTASIKNKAAGRTLFLILLSGVIVTAAYPKYYTNTYVWPWGAYWRSHREMYGYLWMKQRLPKNTKVFTFTKNEFVVGHDMHSDYWSEQYRASLGGAENFSVLKLREALKVNGFEYVVVDERTMRRYGARKMYDKAVEMAKTGFFKVVYRLGNTIWIFRVS